MKTLLLSASYEVLSFVDEKKAMKLVVKDKVEVVQSYDENIVWGSGSMKHPATLRLKKHVRRNYFNATFNRKAIVKRDRSQCQYCGTKLIPSMITIDHVIPRVSGGGTNFVNCVVACDACNNKKDKRTPEQAGMKLLKRPTHPSFSARYFATDPYERWFEGWDDFLRP